MQNNVKRGLLLLLAVLLVVSAAIGATVAFLTTRTESITNTFVVDDITYELTLNSGLEGVTMPTFVTPSTGSQTVAAGSAVFKISGQPTLTGYRFDGWYSAENGGEKVFAPEALELEVGYGDPHTVTNGDKVSLTVYARWTRMDFTVSFDLNADDAQSSISQMTVTYGKTYGALPIPTRPDYQFVGWTFTKNGEDYATKDNIVSIASDHTLHAKWVGSTVYTIKYYANASDATLNGDAKQVTDTKIHDDSYTIKTPTELKVDRGDEWTWTKWNTEPDGSGKDYLGTNVYSANENLTLYAIWATRADVDIDVDNTTQINMGDFEIIPGDDEYSFTIRCKTQGGADGLVIPITDLIPNYAYRLTFSVSFNDFKFYDEDSHSYIFGTNIIEDPTDYHTESSILSQDGKTVTHKYENMQWSTESSGDYNVSIDFVPSQSTMYWFWETTDIQDGQLMSYVFNNFNVQMLDDTGEYGPRAAFEDLTVKFARAPYIADGKGSNTPTAAGKPINEDTTIYGTRWNDYKNGSGQELTARHKNYFHTEYYGLDNLQYRVWGYAGHEVMTIPLEGLTVGQCYELTFTQDLTNAIVYNTNGASLNTDQLYGCAVTAHKEMDANYQTSNSVNKMPNYQDLRKAKVGDVSTHTVVFKATAETMYWQWLLGDLKDGGSAGWKYSVVKLTNVTVVETDKAVTTSSLEVPVQEDVTEDAPEETTTEVPTESVEGGDV